MKHLVKFEASTATIQCSCMKFSFVGILCVHALKVLDKKKKNMMRLPTHYAFKRWTKDAKVGAMKDYRDIDINVTSQELIESVTPTKVTIFVKFPHLQQRMR
jgi:zinc finger SWIM domain-containing protein 3